jgi:hypothetical protein
MQALTEPGTGFVAAALACRIDELGVSRPSDGYLHETWFVSGRRRDVVLKRLDRSVIGDLTVPLEDLIRNTELAGRQGIGAQVLRVDPDEGLILLERLPGVPLQPADVVDAGVRSRVATALRRLHKCVDLPANRVDFLSWSDDWVRSLDGAECRWTQELRQLRDELDTARQLAARLPSRPSFTHNDLLLANFIDTGSETAIIDYDFSGTGSPHFDIGCLFSNCELDAPGRRHFMEQYLAADPGADVDQALACAELHEIFALHANAIVFAWAAYGYPAKFAPIVADMDDVIHDYIARVRAFMADGRHRALAAQLG